MSPSTKKQMSTKTTLATKAKSTTATKKKGAATIRDPDAKPKRPLSAYNLFFQYERDMLLRSKPSKEGQSHETMHMTIHNDPSERRNRSKTVRPPPHGKIGFAELAKIIGAKWKSLDDPARKHFQDLAAVEKKRYVQECKQWKERMERKKLEGETAVTTATTSAAKGTTTKPKKAKKEINAKNSTTSDIEIATARVLGDPAVKVPLVDDDVLPPVPEVPTLPFNGPGEARHSSTVQKSDIYNMLNRACEIAEEGIYASSAAQPTSGMEQSSSGNISYTIGAPTDTAYTTNPYGHNNYQHQHQIAVFAPPTSTITSVGLPHPQHTNVAPNTHPREGYNSHDGVVAPKTTYRHQQLPTTHYQQHSWNIPSNCSSKVSGKAPRVVSNGSIGGAGFGLTGTSGVMDNANFDGDILDFLSRIVSD